MKQFIIIAIVSTLVSCTTNNVVNTSSPDIFYSYPVYYPSYSYAAYFDEYYNAGPAYGNYEYYGYYGYW